LLKVTNAKVWHIIVAEGSFFANAMGMTTAERSSWGRKAHRSNWNEEPAAGEEFICRRVL